MLFGLLRRRQIENNNRYKLCFIENLTLISGLFYLLPYVIRYYLRQKHKTLIIYYINSSKFGKFLAKIINLITKYQVEKLDFKLVNIKDKQGNLLRLRIPCRDMAELQNEITKSSLFQRVLQSAGLKNRLSMFLTKQAMSFSTKTNRSLFRELLLIHVANWKKKNTPVAEQDCELLMNVEMWLPIIQTYASKYGIKILSVIDIFRISLKAVIKGNPMLKMLYFKCFDRWRAIRLADPKANLKYFSASSSPRLGIEYCGHLNLDQPELHSDLFFWQQSKLVGKDILLTFSSPLNPLDQNKLNELNKHNILSAVLSPSAAKVNSVPVYYPPISRDPKVRMKVSHNKLENNWVNEQIRNYHNRYHYWFEYFLSNNIKLYVSWYKYDGNHCVMADALNALGGIMAIYQRAFEEFSSPETAIDADIFFAFSKEGVALERASKSNIPYFVVTGYIGDHRFPLLKEPARKLRTKLQHNGAKRIISFFDENSREDSRWHTGSEFMRVNFQFLLEKVLIEPWFGLIIKPKVPRSLRQRLGKLANLLAQAEKTGRCCVIEGQNFENTYPPAIAALASDVAIHGHLCAATAGVEAALAGVPTLLIDREGWSVSKLYRLGKGRVVFNKWDEAWEACLLHWQNPSSIPGFGDWSSMLDELDPFRDGRAAERMGNYLNWLMEGFKAKLPRETILADAAERYIKAWGKDTVQSVNCNPPRIERKRLNV